MPKRVTATKTAKPPPRTERPAFLAYFEALTEHVWAKPMLLREALTHSSAGKVGERDGYRDYQRLEFFGDRVLGLCVAGLLLELYPKANEGELGRRHAALVKEETLAAIARDWRLGEWIIFGSGERLSGGADKPAILADVVEAVLGALYMDGGMDKVEPVVRTHWGTYAKVLEGRDAKTRLQETLQSRGLALPKYTVLNESGPDHDKYFRIRVSCGLGSADGEGKNKRSAEMIAAGNLLDSFKLPPVHGG